MKRIINNLFSEFLPNYNILLLFAQFFWLVVFIVLKAPISYILTATLIIIVDIGICNSYVEKKKKEYSEDLKSLEKEYSNYISLVNKNIDDISKKIATRTKIELKILDENYYLFNLAKNLEMMKGYKASDKLNTFIEASCFMFAFVNSRKIIVKDKSKNIRVSGVYRKICVNWKKRNDYDKIKIIVVLIIIEGGKTKWQKEKKYQKKEKSF